MTKTERYFLAPAPGHYGDSGRVASHHRSLNAARKAARGRPGLVVRAGSKQRGDLWLRVYEDTYPEA